MSIEKYKLSPKGLGTILVEAENNANVKYPFACVYLYEAEGLKIKEVGINISDGGNTAMFTYEYTEELPKEGAKIRPYIVGPYMPIFPDGNGTGEPQTIKYISIANEQDANQNKKGKINTSKPILLPSFPKKEAQDVDYEMYFPRSIVIEKNLAPLDLLEGEEDLVENSGYFIFILAKTNNPINKWMTNSNDGDTLITCFPDLSNESDKVVNAVTIASVDELNKFTSIVIEGQDNVIDYDVIKLFEVIK